MDMSFGGEYGVYHSAYDSFYWMSHFGDPNFAYHVTAAQVWGIVALRLTEASVLPLDYSDYALEVRALFGEAMKIAKQRRLAQELDEKSARESIDEFSVAAGRLAQVRDEIIVKLEKDNTLATEQRAPSEVRLRVINDALIGAERALTDARGLRGRDWYKHQIYAPGFYTGYAALSLPDFQQALDDRNGANAREALDRIVEAIRRATATLKQAI
jgi:N-acetylated-alpha-linked acidic dipeptidase